MDGNGLKCPKLIIPYINLHTDLLNTQQASTTHCIPLREPLSLFDEDNLRLCLATASPRTIPVTLISRGGTSLNTLGSRIW